MANEYDPKDYQQGGRGCPGTPEELLPDVPFDFLQPPMRRGVTQQGYGGPFLLRGNPIGAFIDTIRNFCFPVPMMQTSSEGGVYADLSGYGLDSGSVGALPYTGISPGYTTANISCGQGTMPDPTNSFCIPTAATTPVSPPAGSAPMTGGMGGQDCSYVTGTAAVTASLTACVGGGMDRKGCLCQAAQSASVCAQIQSEPQRGGGTWTNLARVWNRQAGVNCNSYTPPAPKTGPPAMAANIGAGMGTMSGGMGAPGLGGGPGTPPNPALPSPMPTPGNPSAGGNIDPVTGLPIAMAQSVGRSDRMTRSIFSLMDQIPDITTMTEGNVAMVPSAEPLGGSFDPGRITQPFRRPNFMQRFFRSGG